MCIHLFNKKPTTSQIGFPMLRMFKYLFVFLLVGSIFNFSTTAQELNSEYILNVASSLQKELEDPFDKLKLANDIKWFFDLRVKIHPIGYEIENQFQRQFNDAFAVFVSTLYSKNFSSAKDRLTEYIVQKLMNAFEKNKDKFQSFYSRLQSKYNYYSKKPPLGMIRQIIQFVVVLNESGTDKLQILMKSTGIWPFC